jgi:Family of unknown function (DUF6476)
MNPNTPPPPTSPRAVQAFPTPSQLRVLKKAVVVMGVIILLLMAAIVARIIYMSAAKSKLQTSTESALFVLPPPQSNLTLALPAGAIIRSSTLNGNHLAVHHSVGDTDAIAILDLATGKIISRIKIERSGK